MSYLRLKSEDIGSLSDLRASFGCTQTIRGFTLQCTAHAAGGYLTRCILPVYHLIVPETDPEGMKTTIPTTARGRRGEWGS